MEQRERRMILIKKLMAEQPEYAALAVPEMEDLQEMLLRSLMNARPAGAASSAFLEVQDAYLREAARLKGITDISEMRPLHGNIYVRMGSITALRCDAIVVSASPALTGCFKPACGCADNAVHTFAGVQLRAACAELIEKQGHEEAPGGAVITPAFNLPCRYVIHTVGPEVGEAVTDEDRKILASCYASSLALARDNGCQSVAFCCISTGESNFPHLEAAKTAVAAVEKFLAEEGGADMKVIFNTYKEIDYEIYWKLLR